MRVLWLTNIPSPYRVDFFNELGKTVNLTVAFERKYSEERSEEWRNYSFDSFSGVFLSGIKIGPNKSLSISVARLIKEFCNDIIIVQNPATPTGMYAITYMKLHSIKHYIESDGAFPSTQKGIKEYIKKFLYSGSNGYLSTSETGDQYFRKYVGQKANIMRYPFTSIREKNILENGKVFDEMEKNRIDQIRSGHAHVVLSVGQFIHRKGFDILLQATDKLAADTIVYFIGGIATKEYKELSAQVKINTIVFLEFMSPEQLRYYFLACDVFVLPTREDVWGLVINEAMAYGCPVVTTKRCVAGLEMVQEGKNGYLVEVDDVRQLSERTNEILNNDVLRGEMKEKALQTARRYTIEAMAKTHHDLFRGMQ